MKLRARGIANGAFIQRLDNVSLKRKLYIGLGALIGAVFVVGGIAAYSNIANQQLIRDTLIRQRQLADVAVSINNDLLNLQNQAFEFYETWTLTGFETEVSASGFDRAKSLHLDPLLEQLEQIRANIAAMHKLEPDSLTIANLRKIEDNIDAYETTLLAMTEQMERLGHRNTGELGRLQQISADLEQLATDSDLAPLEATLSRIDQYAKSYFLHSELRYARLVHESLLHSREFVESLDSGRLAPSDRAALDDLLGRYYDHFLAAANLHRRLQDSRTNLVSQSNLTSTLVKQLFDRQQADFAASVIRLQRQQSSTILITLGAALFFLLGSTGVALYVTGRIIRPVQKLGDAADQLGAGDLSIRAPVYGGDEIATTAVAFNLMADRLQDLLSSLEQRVADRTRELEASAAELAAKGDELQAAHEYQVEMNAQLEAAVLKGERRSALLQASTEVSRAVAQIRDLDQLLAQVTQLISQHFGFYHAGVFLVDYTHRYAVLRAANSEGGQRMLQRLHKLAVGSEGIVGTVTSTGQPRVALDVGVDAVYFNNPDLPLTRSEVAVPLRIGGEIIGALDVQSTERAAFEAEDVTVLTALADQIAIAIQNARLFHQTQTALEEVQRAQQRYIHNQWSYFAQEQPSLSYEFSSSGISSEDDAPPPEAMQAWLDGTLVVTNADDCVNTNGRDNSDSPTRSALAAPIQIRGETVGVLNLEETSVEHVWTEDEIALVQAVADQLGQALEEARLFQQTQASLAETQTLFQTSRSLAAAQQVEDIWAAVIDAARQRQANACGVFLFDTGNRKDAQELVLVAGWDETPALRLKPGARIDINSVGVLDALSPDQSVTLGDLQTTDDIDDDFRAMLNTFGFSAVLLHPIAVRGRWFGLLTVLYESPRVFGEAETSFYRTLADQAALALEGQRLFNETQRRAEREQMIRQITDKVRATSDLETILQTTVQELGKTLGLSRAFVRLGTPEELTTIASTHQSPAGESKQGSRQAEICE
jgi:GAF domain-containing protein/HAMP domain-containing protein